MATETTENFKNTANDPKIKVFWKDAPSTTAECSISNIAAVFDTGADEDSVVIITKEGFELTPFTNFDALYKEISGSNSTFIDVRCDETEIEYLANEAHMQPTDSVTYVESAAVPVLTIAGARDQTFYKIDGEGAPLHSIKVGHNVQLNAQ
ncbi:MAG: hypothetical protein JKY11_07535 [Alphaproteobacteria bacterium]|nr:hypothetical protein [Alphaproteobacteria bacterium]